MLNLCFIQEVSKLSKQSLCINLLSLNKDNLVASKNDISKNTSKYILIDILKENLAV